MKRTGLTIIALVLALTGCANVEADKETTAAPTEAAVSPDTLQTPSAEPGNGAIDYVSAITKIDTAQISAPNGGEGDPMPLDYEALTAPPALTVSTLEHVDSVIASRGNYHWSHTLPDGTTAEVLACGAHPLDQQEHPIIYTAFPAGTLPFSEDGGAVGTMVPVFHLDFGGISPETVSAIRWPASYIGDAQGHSTDFETVASEFDGDTILLLPLGDGEYIYEVSAEWGNAGGASYTFRTLPQIRRAQADMPAGIFDALNSLEYQPFTCDCLPEYRLTAADGTVYSINLSEKWVWRGNNEQAELSDELAAQLRETAERE